MSILFFILFFILLTRKGIERFESIYSDPRIPKQVPVNLSQSENNRQGILFFRN